MDLINILSLAIGIIGILLAIYFGIRKKRPCKLTYFPGSSMSLFDTVTNDFPELEVKFDNKPVTRNLRYIDGFILCSGYDINSSSNNLKMILNPGCKWERIIASGSNSEIRVFTTIDKGNDNTAILTFNSLRRDDCILFRAIIHRDINQKNQYFFTEDIAFEHRIENTENVRIINRSGSYYFPIRKQRVVFLKWARILPCFLAGLTICYVIFCLIHNVIFNSLLCILICIICLIIALTSLFLEKKDDFRRLQKLKALKK